MMSSHLSYALQKFLAAMLMAFSFMSCLCLTSCSCFDGCSFFDRDACRAASIRSSVPLAPDDEPPPPVLSVHTDEVLNIIQEVSTNFKHDRHINLQHSHTYFNEDGIQTIQLQYITQNISDMCEARMLIVDLVEALLTRLNENPYLIPEFPNFAFYPYNFEIYITFESFFIRYIDPFYIKWICMEDGQIAYYAANLDDNNKDCWSVRRESFYTSRDIVFFERKAEDEYKKAHSIDFSIFGDKRFVPKDEKTD